MYPRRLYVQANQWNKRTPHVRDVLALALHTGRVIIPDYEYHKTMLPQLSID
jgi:hypothetical protein